MGYSKIKKNPQPTKRRHRGLIIGLILLLVVCAGATGLLVVLKSSLCSDYEPTPEEREKNTLHIKNFLGYEFGKSYPRKVEVLEEPWFGFTEVKLNEQASGGPLYSLTFSRRTKDNISTFVKNSDEAQGQLEFYDLINTISEKYDIDYSVEDGKHAIYYGKYTEIKVEHDRGTLVLEITDIDSAKENQRQFVEELGKAFDKALKQEKENIKRDHDRKQRDAERM